MRASIPKGTRDFTPDQVRKRNYIFDVMRTVFTKYGFQPLETPSMEKLETLTGKYGEEGDRLLFKILNNGDFLAKANEEALAEKNSKTIIPSISKRGLRYDLTVPFARFVVMHQNEISFPFKRYQIQPVWRADRPQKGRYQEFYQCDVDVVGSHSLMYEAECVQIYDEVLAKLNIESTIRINNRKILAGYAELIGSPEKLVDLTISIDKLDKIGEEGVQSELSRRGFNVYQIDQAMKLFGTSDLKALKKLFTTTSIGLTGITEVEQVFQYLSKYSPSNQIIFDPTLARGLSYYTGCIFEVEANDYDMGSIGGGGRYDDLTALFGLKNMSGVGVSFGAERIYDIMEANGLFPLEISQDLDLLFIAFDQESHLYAYACADTCRKNGIHTDIYPVPTKLKKQMKYANSRNVPYVALVGSKEMNTNTITIKEMITGEQSSMTMVDLIKMLK